MDTTALGQAASVLNDAKEAIKMLLEKDYSPLHTGLEFKLNQMINQINFVGGNSTQSIAPPKFEPVTTFMGTELKVPKMVQAKDLTPEELEKKIFRDKVTTLRDNFDTLENQQILDSYVNEPNVIRGVAKLAGVEYRDVEVNGDFLDKIRAGMVEQAKLAAKKQADSQITGAATPVSEDLVG